MNLRLFLAALLVVSAVPVVAVAQPSEADKTTARDLTIEGYDALDRKDYKGALDRFTRADALFHAPTITLGLARAHVGLGKLAAAQQIYGRLVRETISANASDVLRQAISDGKKELAALEPRIPYVTITVRGAASPRVTLDGADVPDAALGQKRPVDPGKHVLRATAPGLAPAEATVTLGEGKSEAVTLELKPAAATPPAAAEEKAPPAPEGAAAPMHLRRKVGIGVGAAGLASVGVGVGVGVAALGVHGDLEKACRTPTACPNSQQGAIDTYHALGNASTALIIVGGAATVAGVVLFFTAPKAQPENKAFVAPMIGAGYLGAEGRF